MASATLHLHSLLICRAYSGRRQSPLATPLKAIEESSEAADEAYQRRMRESQRVEERVKYIYNQEDWHRELAKVRTHFVTHPVTPDSMKLFVQITALLGIPNSPSTSQISRSHRKYPSSSEYNPYFF